MPRVSSNRGRPSIPGEPLLYPTTVLRALRARERSWPPPTFRLFSHARYALASYVLENHPTGALYVPSYICADAAASLRALGHPVVYYPVTERLGPDWGWLERRAQGHSGALLLVHYFGFPGPLDDALDFCRRLGLALIEDSAHSFLSKLRGKLLGTYGDAGVYSFRKMVPVADGAALIVSGAPAARAAEVDARVWHPRTWAPVVRALIKSTLYRSRLASQLWTHRRQPSHRSRPETSGPSAPQHPQRMSWMSRRLMNELTKDFETISATRLRNYRQMREALSAFPEAVPLFPDAPDGVCPYMFPVLVTERDALLRRLQAEGIPARPWPELPAEVAGNHDFPVANRYAEQVLLFPVHHDMNEHRIEELGAAYRRVRRA